ncbi:TPA: helix-turn-helix transcriptional regulator [Streptococcus equi subsp. zooepidemicus]|nr:helix-turn-helix transcriptional regulator [Streptococcus equi subsp. zooepidemicus]HEL0066547.1 helix-turn-helix transcriptional regulator [Streptococcus equi subsp. zooepidemicus]HEL0074625.1 helix-turn-helix transcriptional regulator [Streptococcus equi subsp. zooepidemicus]HEL0088799.1 helix-turn-helix transcriptional regulator [Streptococcus equi subsp. zooepidemicus]HEL0218440.1 helix-turn-helix transcriptional regulator [Streptococcus equi subsp. zooepidemicus]
MWEKIEALLIEKKMTKYELSQKAGLNQNSLIDLKKGRKKSLKFDDVVKIADVLGVSTEDFR